MTEMSAPPPAKKGSIAACVFWSALAAVILVAMPWRKVWSLFGDIFGFFGKHLDWAISFFSNVFVSFPSLFMGVFLFVIFSAMCLSVKTKLELFWPLVIFIVFSVLFFITPGAGSLTTINQINSVGSAHEMWLNDASKVGVNWVGSKRRVPVKFPGGQKACQSFVKVYLRNPKSVYQLKVNGAPVHAGGKNYCGLSNHMVWEPRPVAATPPVH